MSATLQIGETILCVDLIECILAHLDSRGLAAVAQTCRALRVPALSMAERGLGALRLRSLLQFQ